MPNCNETSGQTTFFNEVKRAYSILLVKIDQNVQVPYIKNKYDLILTVYLLGFDKINNK